MAAALILVIGVGGIWLVAPRITHSPVAVTSASRGLVLWRDGQSQEVEEATELQVGDELHHQGSQSVTLRFTSGDRIDLAGASRLLIEKLGTSPRFSLPEGRISVAVSPRSSTDWRCRTPHSTVAVLGTRFSVTTTANRTAVAVREGRVQMTGPDGIAHVIEAGQELSLPQPVPVREPEPDPVTPAEPEPAPERGAFHWDFEAPDQPWRLGERVPTASGHAWRLGPQPGESHLAASLSADQLARPQLFIVGATTALRFRYRPIGHPTTLRVQAYDPQRDDNFGRDIDLLAENRWHTLTLPLVEWDPNDPQRPDHRMRSGDSVIFLKFLLDPGPGQSGLMIDDVAVVDPADAP